MIICFVHRLKSFVWRVLTKREYVVLKVVYWIGAAINLLFLLLCVYGYFNFAFIWQDVLSVAFSVDNRQIVSGSRDKTIKLWNTLAECKYTIQEDGHSDWVCATFPHPQYLCVTNVFSGVVCSFLSESLQSHYRIGRLGSHGESLESDKLSFED